MTREQVAYEMNNLRCNRLGVFPSPPHVDLLDYDITDYILQRESALREQLARETAIVDRVWNALGITAYTQAGGKAIDELVTALREENGRLRGLLRAILAADERGQGLLFKEAMDAAYKELLK